MARSDDHSFARTPALKLAATLALLVAGLLVNACTTSEQAHQDGATTPDRAQTAALQSSPSHIDADADYVAFNDASAKRIIRAGMKGISDRYIDAVSTSSLGMDALRGLSALDPAITIETHETKITLHHEAFDLSAFDHKEPHELIAFKIPDEGNFNEWAEVIAGAVTAAQKHGFDIRISNRERIYEALFDGMLVGLDVFSRYAGAEEATANRAQRDGFGGLGIEFSDSETLNGGFAITKVMAMSPAENAGLRVGDFIISVAGHKVQGKSIRQVSKLMRGPIGSLVRIEVIRKLAQTAQIGFEIERAHIVLPTVSAYVEDALLVVRITSFNNHTASAVHDQFRKLGSDIATRRIRGVVLDLRSNPGGLLMQSVNVADLFLEQGQIVSTRGRHPDSEHNYQAAGIDIAQGLPLAILIDEDSASAAEIVASALQDQGRGVVIGSTSYGKGTVQTVLMLPNSGEITLTWSRLVTPSGYAFHGLGVLPVVCADEVSAAPQLLAPSALRSREALIRQWREIGTQFDARRQKLRQNCPGRVFEDHDPALMALTRNVLESPELYRQSVLLTAPVDTASRK